MNVEDGTVIASTHRRHRATEFKKSLAKIDQQVPESLDVHVVCDNYGTHKHPTVKTLLGKHPRFHMHFTPTYSSWINEVKRLFAEVTRDLLQRSDHRSVQALEKDLGQGMEREPEALHLDQDRRPDPRIPRTTIATN
ncbi:transposase [Microbacterium ulmi]|uniref:transposase n=1 Tax=Microbacterium ulmi TaxID=179095 RepID=UPI001FB8A75D|nr:transposase [Microbacterium ulmi]NII69537.1 transposase [Microbacterium ulmi]